MLEQIKQAKNEWDALDIERKILLTKSDELHKLLDKLRMDLYSFHRNIDKSTMDNVEIDIDPMTIMLMAIQSVNIAIKETEEEYQETQKKYSHTWPKVDQAKKKVEKLKKKFWEQEGLTL